MSAHHHHHHVDADAGDARVLFAIVINLALTVAQLVGGAISGSLALIADAIHNLSDALSLVIAYAARRIARRPSDAVMTYGYQRAEIVAALINYTTLIVIGLYLVVEAVMRFIEPQDVDGWLVIVVAGVALVIDLATAILTGTMSKSSMNIRAVFLHNLADALGSVAVIVAGSLILLYDWRLVDPIVTLLIAGYILRQSLTEVRPVIRIVMLGSPPNIDTAKVLERMQRVRGVDGVHHVHLWQMQEDQAALEAHLAIAPGAWSDADAIKARVKRVLENEFGILHSTLEIECSIHACVRPNAIGHPTGGERP